MRDIRTYLTMLSALTTASTAISSARTVMNFTRHFIAGPPIAMLPGRSAAYVPYSNG